MRKRLVVGLVSLVIIILIFVFLSFFWKETTRFQFLNVTWNPSIKSLCSMIKEEETWLSVDFWMGTTCNKELKCNLIVDGNTTESIFTCKEGENLSTLGSEIIDLLVDHSITLCCYEPEKCDEKTGGICKSSTLKKFEC